MSDRGTYKIVVGRTDSLFHPTVKEEGRGEYSSRLVYTTEKGKLATIFSDGVYYPDHETAIFSLFAQLVEIKRSYDVLGHTDHAYVIPGVEYLEENDLRYKYLVEYLNALPDEPIEPEWAQRSTS